MDQLTGILEKKTVRVIVIDSLGGEIEPSIRLSRIIIDNNIMLLVNEICMSACAQYLLFSAPRIGFRENSLVAMHDTQFSTNILRSPESLTERLKYVSELEQQLYRDLGLDQELLTLPLAALQVECVVGELEASGSTVGLRVKSKFDWFVPSNEFLLARYPGDFVTDLPQVERVARKVGRVSATLGRFTRFSAETDYIFSVEKCISK
ncbi:MAG: hypothetical protein AAF829_11230 [Pseudomonadota bacterium]